MAKEMLEIILDKERSIGNIISREKAQKHFIALTLAGMDIVELVETEKHHNPSLHGRMLELYPRVICRKLGLSEDETELITLATSLHDIGKINIPEHILNKPGPLTPYERQIIEKHPIYSKEIIYPFTYIGQIALCHHERIDGTGYPNGLRGDEIPLGSRIISVIEVYNVKTHQRPYNQVVSREQALEEILRCRGTQLDPVVAGLFVSIIEEMYNLKVTQ